MRSKPTQRSSKRAPVRVASLQGARDNSGACSRARSGSFDAQLPVRSWRNRRLQPSPLPHQSRPFIWLILNACFGSTAVIAERIAIVS